MDIDVSIGVLLDQKGRGIWSVGPNATVYEAIQEMAERGVGALLVMSEERLMGIVSERDYARKVILRGKHSKETLVREIMTSPVYRITAQHTLQQALRVMTDKGVGHLPVLDGDRVVGVVSIGDLARWIISAQSQAIEQLQGYITGGYPG